MTPVRQLYVNNLRGNLDATLAAANSAIETVYPPGTVLQLVPDEAMVKRDKGFNRETRRARRTPNPTAAGFTPTELSTEAAVTLDQDGQAFRISRSALTLRAKVPILTTRHLRALSARQRKTVRCPRFSTPLSRWTRSWSPDRKLAFNGKGWDA